MIKVKVDFTRCDANGTCAALMPDIFEIEDGGTMQLRKSEIDGTREEALEEAILCCPMGAISRERERHDFLPAFEPFDTEAGPHAGGKLEGKGIAYGADGYTVLGYETATKVLRDKRFQNAALKLMEEFGITSGPVHQFRAQSVIMVEGKPHMRLRTPLARFMGPASVEAMRDVLRRILAELTEGLRGPVPFHTVISGLIPARVYCHLAGAPGTDAPKVASLSERTLSLLTRDRSLKPIIVAAYDELFDYLQKLIAEKKADGLGSDMLSFLISEQEAGKLSPEELLNDAAAMLEASSVNTTHQIGLAVWALLSDRQIWDRLQRDPSLIGPAVIEALRLYPRPGIVSKIATETIELDGVSIPEGADVHVAIWSANRDPERFGQPGVFDLDRPKNQPLTFSTGPHSCLGQSLARVEIEEVIRHLVEHYPNSEIVEDGTLVERAGGRWFARSLVVDLKA